MKVMRLFWRGWHATVIGAALGGAQALAGPDFTLTMQPDSATLIPGKTASFVLSLTALDGFASQVTLTAEALPGGVSAQFTPNPIKPPGTVLLTLSATTNADLGSFTLNVAGGGGGVTNSTSSSVTVNFGLLPICTSGFEGVVTDTETALPVSGAVVTASYSYILYQTSDAAGHFLFANVPLAADNLAARYNLQANRTDYWPSPYVQAYAVCDVTNTVNFQILRKRYGKITGTVVNTDGTPIAGAGVSTYAASVVTDSQGAFQFPQVELAPGNLPSSYNLNGQFTGYWPGYTNVTVAANSNSVARLVLQAQCGAVVTGQVVLADTGLPAAGAPVTVSGGSGSVYGVTDTNGNYSATNVKLSTGNGPLTSYVSASAPGYYQGSTNLQLTQCGLTYAAPVLRLQPIPHDNFGAVSGHVYDFDNGAPITNAWINYGAAFSDANGAFVLTNVLVGNGSVTSRVTSLVGSRPGYYQATSNLTLYANQTVTQDLRLLRMHYGRVVGVVRDSASHLPIAKATVGAGGAHVTGADGQYDSGPLELYFPNVPTLTYLNATAAGYWPTYTNTTITADQTNVLDIDLIQVCTGATIVGNVVDAVTQKPITNATINANNRYASTDASGNFILTNLTVGNLNAPIQTTVTASAPGYNPQTRTPTIFCGATITTEFGRPQTVFGAVEGYVTNALTGLPLTNIFIGSEFGGATTTDSNGYYRLNQAPLGANGADRTWKITALPPDFPAQSKSVTVSSNLVSRLDFGFGRPLTQLRLASADAPDPVTVGSNLVYTITLQNLGADAANVVLRDTLPLTATFAGAAISNAAGSTFSTPTLTEGVLTANAATFASNATAVLVITVQPTATGTVTNLATVASDTPDVDATGTNHFARSTTVVIAPMPLDADLALGLTAAPNPVLLTNSLTYTVGVTNRGPAEATDVIVTDPLPTEAQFVRATAEQGTTRTTEGGWEWSLGTLAPGASASATIVVRPLVAGSITNRATVAMVHPSGNGSSTIDPDSGNNTASAVTVVNGAPLTDVAVAPLGPITFDRQTGLFQQTVRFNNLSTSVATAVRITVPGLPTDVVLYNASGSSEAGPYVQYDLPVASGGSVDFLLEYYRATRAHFSSTNFNAAAVAAGTPAAPAGTPLELDRDPIIVDGRVLIEFLSVPGRTYVVQYSDDAESWKTAQPPVVAAGTRVQWLDAGPPKTERPPLGNERGQRFYRVVQLP